MLEQSSLFNRPEELDFENLFLQLDQELDRDEESLVLFEWAIEDTYSFKFEQNQEYFGGNPDMLRQHNDSLYLEMRTILQRFEEKEEFEKCAVVLKVMNNLKKDFK